MAMRHTNRVLTGLATVVLAAIALVTASHADDHGTVVEFDIPGKMGSTHEITHGPDGNIWISQQTQARLVRVTADGGMTMYNLPDGSGPHGLEFDGKGRMWVSLEFNDEIVEVGLDGKIRQRFKIPMEGAGPHGLGVGPAGNIWWSGKAGNVIGRLDPATGTIDLFPIRDTPATPIYIAAGPDGNMWFTELEGSHVGRITPDGEITSFPIPFENARPIVVFTGPDGRIWYTEERGNAYGYISTEGAFVRYPTGVEDGLVAGAAFDGEGNLWVQFNTPDIIQRITPSKKTTTFTLPTKNAVQHRITPGPGGHMWFTELAADKVGYVAVGD